MTVNELIARLRALPGDSDLRVVDVDSVISGPLAVVDVVTRYARAVIVLESDVVACTVVPEGALPELDDALAKGKVH